MTELTPETRDALAPQLRAVSDTLDEWLMRAHGILSSWQHPERFLEWLEKRGWTVADKAHIEALEKLLVEQDAGVFGIDPRTGEPVMPWTADECYDWHMRARQAVVPSALPKDTPPR